MYACVIAEGPVRECAGLFSPLVEQPDERTVLFSIAGLRRLMGDPPEVARRIGQEAARLGLTGARIAVADSLEAAHLAARGFAGVTYVEPGAEAARLGGLPLALLDLPAEFEEALAQWGLSTLADYAALEPADVAERLGEPGVRLHRLASGAGLRPLKLDEPAPEFVRELVLEDAESLLEPLLFLLNRLLGELCEALVSQGYAAQNLHYCLTHEKQAPTVRTLRLPFPVRDGRLLTKLLQLHFEAHPFPAAVTKIGLRLDAVPPRSRQEGLFRAGTPAPEQLEITLNRLEQLVGAANVGRAVLLDSHQPRPFTMRRFTEPAPRDAWPPTPAAPVLALRWFDPAVPAQVRFETGHPAHVRSAAVTGAIAQWAGPWKSSGHWWRDDRWNQEEWDIAVEAGVYRLAWEPAAQRWWLEGVYD